MQKGPKEVKTAVGYTRVSTARQGLGREAQAAALARFAEAEGYVLAETFTEVETGKGSDASTDGRSSPRPWPQPGSSRRRL